MRWFLSHLPDDGSVQVKSLGLDLVGLTIAGPKAREVLQKCCKTDISHDAMRFMAVREMDVGMIPAIVGRVSYSGDLGYEIWVKPASLVRLYDDLMAAGSDFDIRPFGARALNALRLEKNYGSWGREYRPLYGPVEVGLDRFIAYDKPADFIGKTAALAERDNGGSKRLISLAVAAIDADVIGDEPVSIDGTVVGWVTSGGFAHASKTSVALAMVPKEFALRNDGWTVELLGQSLKASLINEPLFDANASRMRS